MSSHPACQIVNLGAGFDTAFLHLLQNNSEPTFVYVELDKERVVSRKLRIIRRCSHIINRIKFHGDTEKCQRCTTTKILCCPNYKLVSCDFEELFNGTTNVQTLFFDSIGLDANKPTMFVSECCLIYLRPGCSRAILKFASSNFKRCSFTLYEQVNLIDKFGQIMINSLDNHGCSLLGADECLSLDTQIRRFVDSGFDTVVAECAYDTWNRLDPRESHRVRHIQWLDEPELLEMLLRHYCFLIAANGRDNLKIPI